MPLFARNIPRLIVLSGAVLVFCLISPETFSAGPQICLWQRLFHVPQCPACGTVRALSSFFHGRFSQAVCYNANVLITAPGLLILLFRDAMKLIQRLRENRWIGGSGDFTSP